MEENKNNHTYICIVIHNSFTYVFHLLFNSVFPLMSIYSVSIMCEALT